MTRLSTLSNSSAALCLVLSALAFAGETKVPTPLLTPDADEAAARQLYKAGQVDYDVARFEDALKKYTDAYTLKPLPGFLFNIAQCHRQMQHYKEASFFYGRFIDNSKPDASNVELARELMNDMNKRQAEKDAAERAQHDAPKVVPLVPHVIDLPPPPMPEPEPPLYTKGWFWGAVGAGVAVIAAGTVTAVVLSQPKPPTRPTPTLGEIDGRTP